MNSTSNDPDSRADSISFETLLETFLQRKKLFLITLCAAMIIISVIIYFSTAPYKISAVIKVPIIKDSEYTPANIAARVEKGFFNDSIRESLKFDKSAPIDFKARTNKQNNDFVELSLNSTSPDTGVAVMNELARQISAFMKKELDKFASRDVAGLELKIGSTDQIKNDIKRMALENGKLANKRANLIAEMKSIKSTLASLDEEHTRLASRLGSLSEEREAFMRDTSRLPDSEKNSAAIVLYKANFLSQNRLERQSIEERLSRISLEKKAVDRQVLGKESEIKNLDLEMQKAKINISDKNLELAKRQMEINTGNKEITKIKSQLQTENLEIAQMIQKPRAGDTRKTYFIFVIFPSLCLAFAATFFAYPVYNYFRKSARLKRPDSLNRS